MLQIELTGQCALVTAASHGVGFAIARALHGAGAYVALNDSTPDQVDGAIGRLGGGARLVPAPVGLGHDHGPAFAVSQAVRLLGRLDILVNVTGSGIERGLEEIDGPAWHEQIAAELRAPFFTIQAALPHLRETAGTVLNVTTERGLQALAGDVAGVAAGHGLVALTRALAAEFAADGIRVNALCHGAVDDEAFTERIVTGQGGEEAIRARREFQPLGRMVWPEEIAAFALCLVSPAAAFLTGAAIPFDGGSTAVRP